MISNMKEIKILGSCKKITNIFQNKLKIKILFWIRKNLRRPYLKIAYWDPGEIVDLTFKL
jgi:hypothetical protein